jgi:hypothetical protein
MDSSFITTSFISSSIPFFISQTSLWKKVVDKQFFSNIIIKMCNTKKILERGSAVDRKFDFLNRCSDGRSKTVDAKISSKRNRFDIHMLDSEVGWITCE